MNWREVEQELVAIAKAWGLTIIDNSGHSVIDADANIDAAFGDEGGLWTGPRLDLTEIAKELVDRLGRKG